jgi:Fibronectin type III domain
MKPIARLFPVGGPSLAVVLGLLMAGCGGTSPNAPSISPAGGLSGSTPGTGNSISGTTTTWSCLTAGSVGIFGSAAGCGASGITASSLGRVFALAAPGPSGNLSGSVSGSTVTLNWLAPTSPDPATSYVIEAGSSSGATNIAVFDTDSTATTLTVTGVPAGTYFVRVRAKNSSGSSAPSNEIVLTVGGGPPPCTTAPGVPTGLSAAVSGASVTLTWTAPAGGCPPSTYGVEAGSTSGASNLASVSTNSAATSFAASNVPAGTYFVRVRAGNGSSFGSPSNEVVVTVGNAPPADSVAGRWVGLVANGDGTTLTSIRCGLEKGDWQLDLTQTGSTVTGTLTQTVVVSGCLPVGQVVVAPLTGTAGSGTFSFTIEANPSRTASATFTASRMTGSTTFAGTFAVNRQ